jgi:hypothetical protein
VQALGFVFSYKRNKSTWCTFVFYTPTSAASISAGFKKSLNTFGKKMINKREQSPHLVAWFLCTDGLGWLLNTKMHPALCSDFSVAIMALVILNFIGHGLLPNGAAFCSKKQAIIPKLVWEIKLNQVW